MRRASTIAWSVDFSLLFSVFELFGEPSSRGDGVAPGRAFNCEGEVGSERRRRAERAVRGAGESLLYGADAGGGRKGVGLTGLQPRLRGGTVRPGGSRPPERPVGRGRRTLGTWGFGAGYGRVGNDVRCARGLDGCLEFIDGRLIVRANCRMVR